MKNKNQIINLISSIYSAPRDFMRLGINTTWVNSWTQAYMFANLMYTSNLERASGSGTWFKNQGQIIASNQDNIFRFKLSDTISTLPRGTYTILNPSGCNVAVGGWGIPAENQFSTQLIRTYTISENSTEGSFCLFVKGSVDVSNGNIAVILPNHLESWQSGNIWNNDYLDYYTSMDAKVIRFMDAVSTNSNIEQDWSDKSDPNKVSLQSYCCLDSNCIPWEFIIDLCNRLNADPWINIPPRATSDYILQLANLFEENLNTDRKLIIEYGNEIWNTASIFNLGTSWVTYLQYTKYTAGVNQNNKSFIMNGHGLVNGQKIVVWATKQNSISNSNVNWILDYGVEPNVKVINSEEFELYEDENLTIKINFDSNRTDLLFCNPLEAGKTKNRDINYSNKCIEIWDIFDSVMGVDRIKHLICSQAANTSVTSNRLSVSGITDRLDWVAIAPYFSGSWWGSRIDVSDSTIIPRWWGNTSKQVVVSVYPEGTVLTRYEKINGINSLSSQTVEYVSGSPGYQSFNQITQLTNGQNYDVYFLIKEGNYDFEIKATVSPSTEGGTFYFYDTYQNQLKRSKNSSISGSTGITNHKNLCPENVEIVCYEGGLDFDYPSVPTQMQQWRRGWLDSQEAGDAIDYNLRTIASRGCKLFCYYFDVCSTVYSLSGSYSDKTTTRYISYSSLNGKVNKVKRNEEAAIISNDIKVKPELFPFDVYDFSSDKLYEIKGNDLNNNFTIEQNTLKMVNDYGINWNTPTTVTIYLESNYKKISNYLSINFSLGDSWYPADSKFVWDSKNDSDSLEINPVIGLVPLTSRSGTNAVVSGGLWDMDGCRYTGSPILSGTSTATPFLMACVLDKDNMDNRGYVSIFQIGSGSTFIQYYTFGGINTSFAARVYFNSSDINIKFFNSGTMPAGPQVYWLYNDGSGNFTAGINQNNGQTISKTGVGILTQQMWVGTEDGTNRSNSLLKHGSILFLARQGLTISDAKDIVGKIQTHHQIN